MISLVALRDSEPPDAKCASRPKWQQGATQS
jgi:hypothetical protein